jgi:hypothetical protein
MRGKIDNWRDLGGLHTYDALNPGLVVAVFLIVVLILLLEGCLARRTR